MISRKASGEEKAAPQSSNQEFDDGRSYDPLVVQKITQNWIETHMKEREVDFTETLPALVFCGTWNVNGKTIAKDQSLEDWLTPYDFVNTNGQPISDIYVIGFQEMVDLTVVNVAVDSKSQQRSQFWLEKITETLASKGTRYTHVHSKYLVGLLLCVFVKESAMPFVRDVRSTSVGVGVMGVMGNKGGVCVRLTYYNSSICLVCTHLAAHMENVTGRNADFKNICDKMVFLPVEATIAASTEIGLTDTNKNRSFHYTTGLLPTEETVMMDHDLIFWLGDLNYRIDDNYVGLEEVFSRIESKDLKYLLQYDQLNVERAAGNVFEGFNEGEVTFSPTYKYIPGTSEYDRRPEKKQRPPAWCDRILWRQLSNKLDAVIQLDYTRSDLKPSDHKPVMSLFQVSIRKIIAEKEKNVFQELIKILDKCENDSIPRVLTEGTDIDFGQLHYKDTRIQTVKLKNEGTSIAPWRFVPKLDEKNPCKRWITLKPESGMLLPNEEMDITVSAVVDTITADTLNSGIDILEDIIVLRVENGRDIFVTVKAEYARSCFGMSLEQLVCSLQPVRSIPLPASDSDKFPDTSMSGSMNGSIPSIHQLNTPHMSIPKELWRLIDALWQGGGMDERDIFISSAEAGEVERIRECLDTGAEFPSCAATSIAETIVAFISSLPQPLISPDLYPTQSDIDPQNIRIWSRRFLEQLPPINYNIFVYLMSFQRELLCHKEQNRLTPGRLGGVDVQCMTNVQNMTTVLDEKLQARQQLLIPVITHFLTAPAI